MSDDSHSKIQRLQRDRSRWFNADRQWAQDKRLSYKARGLMAYVMSRPDDWTIWKPDLVRQSEEDGEHAVQTAIQELIDAGYGQYVVLRDPDTKQLKGKRLVLREALDLDWPENLKTGSSAETPIFRGSENPKIGKSEDRKTASHTKTQRKQGNEEKKSKEEDSGDSAPAREAFSVEANDVDAITEAAFGHPLTSGMAKEKIQSDCEDYGDEGYDALRAVCALIARKGWNGTPPLVHKKLTDQLTLIDEETTATHDRDRKEESFAEKTHRLYRAARRGAGLDG